MALADKVRVFESPWGKPEIRYLTVKGAPIPGPALTGGVRHRHWDIEVHTKNGSATAYVHESIGLASSKLSYDLSEALHIGPKGTVPDSADLTAYVLRARKVIAAQIRAEKKENMR